MMSPRITFSASSPILNGKTPLFPEANPKSRKNTDFLSFALPKEIPFR
jgi:hypothetical protein